jgi:hypothetical protein
MKMKWIQKCGKALRQEIHFVTRLQATMRIVGRDNSSLARSLDGSLIGSHPRSLTVLIPLGNGITCSLSAHKSTFE